MNSDGITMDGDSALAGDATLAADGVVSGPTTKAKEEPRGSLRSAVVTFRQLVGDTAVYGLASVTDRAIGFLLLPIMTAILSPTDYGIISLFTTTSHILFVLCALGVHQAFLRHYTEARESSERRAVLNTSLTLAVAYWLLALPIFLYAGETLNRWIFGIEGSALVWALAAATLIEVIDSVASNRLQADGRRWAFFIVTVANSVVLRAAAITLVLLGMGAWGWVLSDTLGRLIAVVLLVMIAMPDARIQPRRELIRPLASYGGLLVPAAISFYVMTVADKYLIRALAEDPLQQVGFYSVGERIASVMQLANLAFIFGWQRFAFRNMHLAGGERGIARGLLWYAIGGSYLALCLALLGDDLTRWLIAAKFAPGIVVITPITLAALAGGLASAAEIGLHKRRRPLHISYLNVAAAALNIGLNLWAIPRWGILGAALATMFSQAVRLLIVWRASQAAFPLPLDFGRLLAAVSVFALIYGAGQFLKSPELLTETLSQMLLLAITPLLLWLVGVFDAGERQTIRRLLKTMIGKG